MRWWTEPKTPSALRTEDRPNGRDCAPQRVIAWHERGTFTHLPWEDNVLNKDP